MSEIVISDDLAVSLLGAASKTALSHRGKKHEEYSLGQLEAVANLIYIFCINHEGMETLESTCLHQASLAVRRLEEIDGGEKSRH